MQVYTLYIILPLLYLRSKTPLPLMQQGRFCVKNFVSQRLLTEDYYPFTEPSATPATMYLESVRYTTSSGNTERVRAR